MYQILYKKSTTSLCANRETITSYLSHPAVNNNKAITQLPFLPMGLALSLHIYVYIWYYLFIQQKLRQKNLAVFLKMFVLCPYHIWLVLCHDHNIDRIDHKYCQTTVFCQRKACCVCVTVHLNSSGSRQRNKITFINSTVKW